MSTSFAGKRVWVAGHRGMVGSAVARRIAREAGVTLLTVDRRELDLRDQGRVRQWMGAARPDIVVLAAAKVGGIVANDRYPADFLSDNLAIQSNVIDTAAELGVSKLLFLGSSCIYPRMAPQPISEDALLTGPLEPTNQWYAIAKIAGLKLCQAYRRQGGHGFISAMPTNLYGPGDNYDPEGSHVLPALIRKAHEAKISGARNIEIWGSGTPLREFLHVDDLADGLVFLLKTYSGDEHVNIGSGSEISIADVARTVMRVVGFEGDLTFDAKKPDGTPRKLMDSSRIAAMGWSARISLEDGLADAYKDFVSRYQRFDDRARGAG